MGESHPEQETVAALREALERLEAREHALRELLMDAHEQLLERDEHLAALLAAVSKSHGESTTGETVGSVSPARYRHLVSQVKQAVSSVTPPGSTVLVASKGDPELTQLDRQIGWHFPQAENGVYAGYYPADGAAAIAHLEDLRLRGAQFIAFPATATWWLERYEGLSEHLIRRHRQVFNDPEICVIFELTAQEEPEAATGDDLAVSVRAAVAQVTAPAATVLVVTAGQPELLDFDERVGLHFPPGRSAAEPIDSTWAIHQLEELRQRGARAFVVPSTARGWFEEHHDLRQHLDSRYRVVFDEPECLIWDLRKARRGRVPFGARVGH